MSSGVFLMYDRRKTPPWIVRRQRLLVGVLVLVVLGTGTLYLIQHRSASVLEAKLARLRSSGVPLTYQEVLKTPTSGEPIAAPKEGTIVVPAVFEDQQLRQLYDDFHYAPGLPADLLQRGGAVLERYAELLLRAHLKIRLPDGGIEHEALRRMSEWFQCKYGDAGVLFLIEAMAAAERGEPDIAFESIALGLASSWDFRNSFGTLQALMLRGLFTDAQLGELAGMVGDMRVDESQSLGYRRVEGLKVLAESGEFLRRYSGLTVDKYLPGTTQFLLNAGELVGYSTQQQARFLEGLEQIEACYGVPRPEGVAQMRSIADGVLGAVVPSTSNIMLMSSVHGFTNQLIHESRINAMTGCVAIERFHRVEGRFPSQWSELSPGYLAQSPEDPCTGAPLRYRTTTDGYTIYSVGLDQNDDHGAHQTNVRELWNDGDYVLIEYPGAYKP